MIIIIIMMIIIVLMGCPQNFQVLVRPTPLLVRSRPLLYPPPPQADVRTASQNQFSQNSNYRPCTKSVENMLYISLVV